MLLSEYFDSNVFEFPGDCGQSDIRDYLGNKYDLYHRYLSSIQNPDENIRRILSEQEKITATSELVIMALDSYFLGHPSKAFNHIGKAISKVRKFFLGLSSKSETAVWINKPGLYRIRTSQLHDLQIKDLFHVPFEMRSKLATQRYSIPGCLATIILSL